MPDDQPPGSRWRLDQPQDHTAAFHYLHHAHRRKDIHQINVHQETIPNHIQAISNRIGVCEFTRMRFPAKRMISNLKEMASGVGTMLGMLEGKTDTTETLKRIKHLKKDCEMLLLSGLGELYDHDNPFAGRNHGDHQVDPRLRSHRQGVQPELAAGEGDRRDRVEECLIDRGPLSLVLSTTNSGGEGRVRGQLRQDKDGYVSERRPEGVELNAVWLLVIMPWRRL